MASLICFEEVYVFCVTLLLHVLDTDEVGGASFVIVARLVSSEQARSVLIFAGDRKRTLAYDSIEDTEA
jgi:hypothetical protein